jgi:hypothetical protein
MMDIKVRALLLKYIFSNQPKTGVPWDTPVFGYNGATYWSGFELQTGRESRNSKFGLLTCY